MKHYHSLDIVRGMAALSVLVSHWGGWTIAHADAATKQLIVLYQNTFQFLLWGGAYTLASLFLLYSADSVSIYHKH